MPAFVDDMIYVSTKGTPWHGLGVAVPNPMPPKDVVSQYLNWTVEKVPVFAHSGNQPPLRVPRRFATVRVNPDGSRLPLGVVGDRYTVVQNSDMAEMIDSLVKEGGIRIHTAGTLKDSTLVWLMGRFHGRAIEVVKDDVVDQNVVIFNSHDGSLPLAIMLTSVRVVCFNTLMAAFKEARGEKKMLTIRHTGDPASRVAEARRVLGISEKAFDELEALMKRLAELPMTVPMVHDGIDAMVPLPDDEQTSSARAQNTRDRLKHLYNTLPTLNMPGVRGTAWGFVNLWTEALDHGLLRHTDADGRLRSAWLGNGADVKDKAVSTALQICV